jgi:hypothetical protein
MATCLGATCLAVVGGIAPAVAQEIRDWPCPQPLALRFAPDAVWGGALPAALPEGWRDDAAVRAVVEFAANPENSPGEGAREIAAFAEELGAAELGAEDLAADRRDRLMLVFAGLLEKFDTLRGFLVGGVRDFVLRAKILRDSVAQNDAALAALPADGSAGSEEERRGYLEARFWDQRNLDDALEEAEFLCHRYAYLDEKLRRLVGVLRSAF